MRLRVDVTASDIENGRVGSCRLCPIALAMRRAVDDAQLNKATIVSVGDYDIQTRYRTHRKGERMSRRAYTPVKAATFIHRFDDKKPVKAISFTIDLKDVN